MTTFSRLTISVQYLQLFLNFIHYILISGKNVIIEKDIKYWLSFMEFKNMYSEFLTNRI